MLGKGFFNRRRCAPGASRPFPVLGRCTFSAHAALQLRCPWTPHATRARCVCGPWTNEGSSARCASRPCIAPACPAPRARRPWTIRFFRAPRIRRPWTDWAARAPRVRCPWTQGIFAAPRAHRPWISPASRPLRFLFTRPAGHDTPRTPTNANLRP